MHNSDTLFVLETLGYGGPATSLINLLGLMHQKYGDCYDVLLFHKNGSFSTEEYESFKILRTNSILEFLSVDKSDLIKVKPLSTLVLLFLCAPLKLFFGYRKAKDIMYRFAARRYKKYRTIIAYQESEVSFFCKFIKCQNRIAWMHTDISKVAVPKALNNLLYRYYNKVVCVSDITKKQFEDFLPEHANKTITVHNTFRIDLLRNKAKEFEIDRPKGEFIFLSVGRIVEAKRFDKIIDIADELVKIGYSFNWIILGDGHLRESLCKKVYERGLQNFIFFLGSRSNPFPYYQIADYFVMTSDYEGYPMVANESLALGVPVISSRFDSISETITNGVDGLIADGIESSDVLSKIIEAISCRDLYDKLHEGVKRKHFQTDKELIIVKSLIED